MSIAFLIKQKNYEKIVYTLRRHWLTFFPAIALFLVMMSVPVLVYYLAGSIFPNFWVRPIFFPISVVLTSIYCLCVLTFFFFRFVEFYLDLWIVTNDRIIDIEQLGLFSRSISELDLFRIQDVSSEVHGFFPTIFRYGNVVVKTASSNSHIIFRNVKNPNGIRENLINLSHADRRFHIGVEEE